MERVFHYVSHKHGTKKALGTREVFAEEEEIQSDGTVLKKVQYILSDSINLGLYLSKIVD